MTVELNFAFSIVFCTSSKVFVVSCACKSFSIVMFSEAETAPIMIIRIIKEKHMIFFPNMIKYLLNCIYKEVLSKKEI